MASIVDSIRSVVQDNYALLKLGGFSLLIYFLYGLTSKTNYFNLANVIIFLFITFLFLGYSSIIINNRIHQRIETLPKFDLVLYFSVAGKAFFILVPYLLIGYFVVNLVVDMFSFEGIPQLIALWIIRYFILTIFVTALISYANNFKINDALNFSSVSSGIPDVMAYTVLSLVFLAIIGVFTAAPILFLIYNFFEFGGLFIYAAAFFVSALIAVMSDYWGQLHYDIESKNNIY